jgi:hypothetical protein
MPLRLSGSGGRGLGLGAAAGRDQRTERSVSPRSHSSPDSQWSQEEAREPRRVRDRTPQAAGRRC